MNEIELKRLIGNRLKTARETTVYNQQDIAEMLGIERVSYSHIEAGRNLIRVDHLIKLCEIFNRPVNYFLGLPDSQEITPDESALLAVYRQIPEAGPFRQMVYHQVLAMLETLREP
jgi:transcriptional regulator with XRE-family HTH domain